MDLEGTMLNEINRDKYFMISLFMKSRKKNQLVNITKKRNRLRFREQTMRRDGRGQGMYKICY